jgi:rod shape determining protein RodA
MKWLIPGISLILASLSLISLRSIAPDLVGRQLLFFIIGFVAFYVISFINSTVLKKIASAAHWSLNIILLGLLVVGDTTRGMAGWINLFGGFKIQPSQFAILTTTWFIIAQLSNLKLRSWSGFFKLIGIITLPGLLIFLEPDFGASLVYFVSLGSILFFLNIKFKYLLSLGAILAASLAVIWLFVLQPYQKLRLTSFTDGYNNQENSATYNAQQALIAVGSGQLYGRGLGFGVQSHLKFLPERQTDFIFASIAEEWGFFGSLILVSLYFVLIAILFVQALSIKNIEIQIFVLVVAAMLFVQAGINIGMNLGLLPITGITLPLVSYGGSSILSFLLSLGIVFGQTQIKKNNFKKHIR